MGYESRKEYFKKRYQEKKEYYAENRKRFDENNPNARKRHWEDFKKNSDKYKVASTEWNKNNRDRINNKAKERKAKNPFLKIQDAVSSTIHYHLPKKTKQTNAYLGCSYEEYFVYLEQQFDENMNWDNYGKDKYWEIDHIHPLSKSGSFHYTNTRPLAITENRKKSNKII